MRQAVEIHGLACVLTGGPDGYQVTSPHGERLASEPTRLIAIAKAAVAVLQGRCPAACRRPIDGGCSHVDCGRRRPVTAAPGRSGDGKIPPRNANTTGAY